MRFDFSDSLSFEKLKIWIIWKTQIGIRVGKQIWNHKLFEAESMNSALNNLWQMSFSHHTTPVSLLTHQAASFKFILISWLFISKNHLIFQFFVLLFLFFLNLSFTRYSTRFFFLGKFKIQNSSSFFLFALDFWVQQYDLQKENVLKKKGLLLKIHF